MSSTGRAGPWAAGARAGLPVGLTFIPTFLAVGAAAEQIHLGGLTTTLMTLTIFAAPAQLVLFEFLNMGQRLLDALFAVLIINSRFFLMSISLASQLEGVPLRKLLPALPMLSASTFATTFLGLRDYPHAQDRFSYYLGVCLASFPLAVVSTGFGYVSASSLPQRLSSAMPMLIALYFAAWISRSWPERQPVLATLGGCVLTPLLARWSPTFATILAALLVGAAMAAWGHGGAKDDE
ncbi:AzlC family ABC transporter permease [Sorangium sp. So ce1128]